MKSKIIWKALLDCVLLFRKLDTNSLLTYVILCSGCVTLLV